MNYTDLIYLTATNLMMVLAVYFFIILCFGTGNRTHSVIIFISCCIGLVIPEVSGESLKGFIRCVNTSILLDGVTALSLTMFLIFDKLAWKQALVLCFATLCHIMIIYDLTIVSSIISNFIYVLYDELIIVVSMLQIAISKDGFINALRNVRIYILRFSNGVRCYSQNLYSSKKHRGSA